MNIDEIRQLYIKEGLNFENANARTAQDLVLSMISTSQMADRVTIKGGVVMQQLSHDNRRATLDIDLDFLRYSISDTSIRHFIKTINTNTSGCFITITGEIEDLKQQDYSGKRAHIRIEDADQHIVHTKLDIGVHKDLTLEQALLCFNFSKLDNAVTLFANSKEQIVAEKLKSLLRIGAASTRYKDVFDIYYLVFEEDLDTTALQTALSSVIFDDKTMRENTIGDIRIRLEAVLSDKRFTSKLKNARNNWLQLPIEKTIEGILDFFKSVDATARQQLM
jgi:predicted nucleotidyltransferase component of viral defense system